LSNRVNVRVLTFNVGLLELTFAGRRIDEIPYREERLVGIVKAIGELDADIVCLQEVFKQSYSDALVGELESAYPYHARHDNKGRLGLGHGLLTLSKFPLQGSRFVPFRAGPRHEKLMIRRGFIEIEVKSPTVEDADLTIFNLHTTAGGRLGTESDAANRFRDMQLLEIHDAVRAASGPSLVCGDFNAGPEASAQNYDHFLDLGYADAAVLACGPDGLGPTWLPGNPLVRGFADSPPQRIDHIFLDTRAAGQFRVVHAAHVFQDAQVQVDGQSVTLSDHYGLVAELQRM
jgi:endonuclease/exonuclease/phosphatase family metal-dependent hydrolase